MKNLAAFLLVTAVLAAQSPEKKPAFEFVTIKPHKPADDPSMMPFGVVGGRYNAVNAHLRQLIVAAYVDSGGALQGGVEISGLPGWAASEGFDVQAQTEAGLTPTKQQTMEMLQQMLEDRFKLKIRRESKSAPIYSLIVDPGGSKLEEIETPTAGPVTGPRGPGHIRAPSIQMLVMVLTGSAGRKVVDKTGLTGLYKIELNFAPDPPPPGVAIDPSLPSLFTALREQLGLRLVAETGLVDAFVVESVERPTEN